MSLFTWVGWLICGILGVLLVIQLRSTRDLLTPRRGKRKEWPALSVLVRGTASARFRESLGSIARQEYEGELEILVLVDRSAPDVAQLVEQLAIAHPRIRRLEGTPDLSDDRWPDLARAAGGDFLMFVGPDLILEPDAAATAVGHAEDSSLDTIVLTPRVRAESAVAMLLLPLVPFIRMTFFPREIDARAYDPASDSREPRVTLVRRTEGSMIDDRQVGHLAVLNGRFVVTHHSAARNFDEVIRHVSEQLGAGGFFARRSIGFAVLLLLLFVLPPLAALATGSFAWLMGTVIGLFLRLRTAVRTGEPVALTLLHPVAILAAIPALVTSKQREQSP